LRRFEGVAIPWAHISMRIPEVWVDPEGPGPAYVELVEVRVSGETTGPRIQIPAQGRNCVEWLKAGAPCDALIEISEPGRIRLLPWAPHGEAVVARRRELAREPYDEQLNELLSLTERFRRIHVEKNGRFPVHDRELFHLGLNPATTGTTLLICLPGHVELWNEDFRRRWREQHPYNLPWG
jgi:hypothetical protein